MRLSRRVFTTALSSIVASAATGCVTSPDRNLLSHNVQGGKSSVFDRLPWVGNDDDDSVPEPYPNPVKLAATWTPDTLIQIGRTPTRGFGGRVFFYNEKSQPVPVDGTLTIHGFDENSEDPKEGVKRFVFTPEQLTRHFGQSDLGASYSIWLPWDAAGGEQRRISLVTSFQAASGATVQGIPATMLLPGKDTSLQSTDKVAELSPKYREYLAATRSENLPNSGLTTTTIRRGHLRRNEGENQPAITIPSYRTDRQVIAGAASTEAKSSVLNSAADSARRPMPTFLPASSGE